MHRIFVVSFALLFLNAGCRSAAESPAMLTTLDQAAQRLSELAGSPVRAYSTVDFGRVQNSDARSVIADPKEATTLVRELRNELGPGLIAFVGCRHSLADDPPTGWEVVVAPGQSQFDILRVAQTDAVNYAMTAEDLIRKLEEYHRDYGIQILVAETDTVIFELSRTPGDMLAFCQNLYEFCPDIVDQGAGTVEALSQSISDSQLVHLWWD